MKRKHYLLGQRFGRLLVLEEIGHDHRMNILWKCKCDCGNETIVISGNLVSGSIKSCGCGKHDCALDFTGQRFGVLTAIQPTQRRQQKNIIWLCRCDCGAEVYVSATKLKLGRQKSCGRSGCKVGTTTHGYTIGRKKPSVYKRWNAMIQRCTNPNAAAWKDYGGRGISVCDRWMKFENFLIDMGEPPQGLSLDRINNDGNYEPGNCRWATPYQQTHNRRKGNNNEETTI